MQLSLRARSALRAAASPFHRRGTSHEARPRLRACTGPPGEGILPAGLRAESLPRHVAVTMDGHSRWARARGMPTSAGHAALQPALKETVRLSRAWGIRVLTVFAFSLRNWNRPKEEVDFLMGVFDRFIQDNVAQFAREGIRLRVIGDCSRLPKYLQKTAQDAEEETRSNSQLDLMLAISYSGQRDVLQACQKLAQKVHNKLVRPEEIDESLFANELHTSWTHEFPCPDLLIRTGGELRLSDFLLWQSAYTELFFTDTLWPDFGEAEYLEALVSFESRDRRFGKRKL
ncbi:cis-prenyltransferase 4, chloroplastic-like [Hordeum vulgare subsp. vulgare]|uniref:Alkyl transferase n=1 Tax=Hordeum vulgare subsp. vulgare TaxID=112509 RepID=A0A8I6XTM4_HORVV|nr:cis-prenyltransferase 4, chloroplastic-like [Hordeum vulgare subsp. vulgare]